MGFQSTEPLPWFSFTISSMALAMGMRTVPFSLSRILYSFRYSAALAWLIFSSSVENWVSASITWVVLAPRNQ